MRILAIMVLTLTLVGCTGDRIKQGTSRPEAIRRLVELGLPIKAKEK